MLVTVDVKVLVPVSSLMVELRVDVPVLTGAVRDVSKSLDVSVEVEVAVGDDSVTVEVKVTAVLLV